ncbi:Hypothetical protein CINCED_3A003374 [Cinara cedri]|uniref:Gem-associated protein 6 Sm-like domain-containing protein n=2 Tax=Cinara cedri TaxID=506608 RepID=A0A5E4MS68_9HEMI|nr:Hypothetical protein CINCED_3A003374 [Cinara cedri]
MKGTCIVNSMNASSLMEFVDKTVLVRTKQQYESKGVVHTIDPVTKSVVLLNNGRFEIISGINIVSVHVEDS